MSETSGSILYVLFLWWFGTGLILYLDGLPRRTFSLTLAAATVLMALALACLVATRDVATPYGAMAALTSVILIWGWNEVAFLTGFLTGPRKVAAPPGATGWQRFRAAVAAILHHELALAVSGLAIVAATWNGANQVGVWTFALLWTMRLSTKLNIFLGVPHNATGFLPPHLTYLETYFRRRPINWLFPVSATLATVAAVLLVAAAIGAGSHHDAVAFALLATLAALGLVEHWVLVLPVRMAALWRWSLGGRERMGASADVQQCRISLIGTCEAGDIDRILDDVARGAYGEIARLDGCARAGAGWIDFGVDAGRKRFRETACKGTRDEGAVAVGRMLDAQRLQAAFDRCAVARAA